MLRTPDAAYDPTTWRTWRTDIPTQVRCASGVSDVSSAIRPVTRTVRSWVVPPAPYVTDTKAGPHPLELADRQPQLRLGVVVAWAGRTRS